MNSIVTGHYPLFRMYQALRDQMMEILTDDDLAFRLPGDNATLGALSREMGEVEYSYIQSFRTLRQDFAYRNEEPNLEGSVEKLSSWFARLDGELKSVIEGFSEEDVQNLKIDRGGDFIVSLGAQLHIYQEALLIFYGKSSVYLKAMEKDLSEQWREWIS